MKRGARPQGVSNSIRDLWRESSKPVDTAGVKVREFIPLGPSIAGFNAAADRARRELRAVASLDVPTCRDA